MTQAEVAKHLNINQAEYSRIEQGRRRVGVHATTLSELFSCTADDLLRLPTALANIPSQEDLPLYALPEMDGESVRFDMSMSSRVDRPSWLQNAANAFSIFNCGHLMAPRLNHGDLLYCDPDEKAVINDLVVLVLKRGNRLAAITRQFVGDGVYTSGEGDESFDGELEAVAPVVGIKLARGL